jgi:hypothetical protein
LFIKGRANHAHRPAAQALLALAVALVAAGAMLLLAPSPSLAQAPQSWTLRDQAGRSWSLTLLEQADPAYPGGLRLRLTDRSGTQRLDHRRSLQIRDGLGGAWELANRSGELVPTGVEALPDGSAQFELPGLEPPPRAELPLALAVPLQAGGETQLLAGAEAVEGLHGAASRGRHGDR